MAFLSHLVSPTTNRSLRRLAFSDRFIVAHFFHLISGLPEFHTILTRATVFNIILPFSPLLSLTSNLKRAYIIIVRVLGTYILSARSWNVWNVQAFRASPLPPEALWSASSSSYVFGLTLCFSVDSKTIKSVESIIINTRLNCLLFPLSTLPFSPNVAFSSTLPGWLTPSFSGIFIRFWIYTGGLNTPFSPGSWPGTFLLFFLIPVPSSQPAIVALSDGFYPLLGNQEKEPL